MGRLKPLHQMTVVMRKELKDSLRDRRALFSIAFSIVVGPVLIGFMMNRIADRQRESESVSLTRRPSGRGSTACSETAQASCRFPDA